MEFVLRSPPIDKEEPSLNESVSEPVLRPSWRSLDGLLRLRAFEALGHREFRLIWYGQIFTAMATWMDQVARGWLIYELTNSALRLGLVRGVQAIPILLLSPLAGSAADRYSRKMQVMVAQVVDGVL